MRTDEPMRCVHFVLTIVTISDLKDSDFMVHPILLWIVNSVPCKPLVTIISSLFQKVQHDQVNACLENLPKVKGHYRTP